MTAVPTLWFILPKSDNLTAYAGETSSLRLPRRTDDLRFVRRLYYDLTKLVGQDL